MTVSAPVAFAIAVAVRPISSNAKVSESRWYTQLLQEAARARTAQVLTGPLYVRIIWFQGQRSPGDIDNIAKRILDALKGIVFEDDDEIVQCLTQKTVRESDGSFVINVLYIPSGIVLVELERLLIGENHVLYIEIGPAADPTVFFGTIR